jgi:hypothetical protein
VAEGKQNFYSCAMHESRSDTGSLTPEVDPKIAEKAVIPYNSAVNAGGRDRRRETDAGREAARETAGAVMTIHVDLSRFDTSKGREVLGESWDCRFCKRAVSAKAVVHVQSFRSLKNGRVFRFTVRFMECPHHTCKEVAIRANLEVEFPEALIPSLTDDLLDGRETLPREMWIRPTSPDIKDFSEYVPEAIRRDYEEACLIRMLSPKASATLSRRCLQGMIRNFYGVSKNRLINEINAIKDKVDPQTWGAIDGLSKIGNIGAHMEKDVNLIIDVDLEEAKKLIKLNELLFKEWYINREERRKLVQEVADLGKQKQAEKKAGNKPAADA